PHCSRNSRTSVPALRSSLAATAEWAFSWMPMVVPLTLRTFAEMVKSRAGGAGVGVLDGVGAWLAAAGVGSRFCGALAAHPPSRTTTQVAARKPIDAFTSCALTTSALSNWTRLLPRSAGSGAHDEGSGLRVSMLCESAVDGNFQH